MELQEYSFPVSNGTVTIGDTVMWKSRRYGWIRGTLVRIVIEEQTRWNRKTDEFEPTGVIIKTSLKPDAAYINSAPAPTNRYVPYYNAGNVLLKNLVKI